jgi:hypothetical protein
MSKRVLIGIVILGSAYLVRGLIFTVNYPSSIFSNPILIIVAVVVAVCAYYSCKTEPYF